MNDFDSPSLVKTGAVLIVTTGATLLTVTVLFSVSLPAVAVADGDADGDGVDRAGRVIGPGALERAGLGGVVEAVGIEGQLGQRAVGAAAGARASRCRRRGR